MRGRSESLTACHAASMSCLLVRAKPQITGPSTSRAIACTDSKSPGEVIGKPASITSTPNRESWWAISSFSCLFNEIPGDCSPSRKVVSKIFTRSAGTRLSASTPPAGPTSSMLMSFVLLLYLACSPISDRSSLLGLRLRGRHALFPPRGEQEELQGRELKRHLDWQLSSRPGCFRPGAGPPHFTVPRRDHGAMRATPRGTLRCFQACRTDRSRGRCCALERRRCCRIRLRPSRPSLPW